MINPGQGLARTRIYERGSGILLQGFLAKVDGGFQSNVMTKLDSIESKLSGGGKRWRRYAG